MDSNSRLTICVERVGIRVEDRAATGQRGGGGVAVPIVLGTRAVDGRRMGFLVKCCGGLILGVTLGSQAGQIAEEEWAVDDVVVRGKGVGKDVGRAAAVDVGAVSASGATGA